MEFGEREKERKKKSNNKCKIARATTVGQKHVGLVLGYIGVSGLGKRHIDFTLQTRALCMDVWIMHVYRS